MRLNEVLAPTSFIWPSSHKTASISQFGNKGRAQTADVCSAASGNRLTARLGGGVTGTTGGVHSLNPSTCSLASL